MPSDAVDFRHRAHLTELMDGPSTREELRACLRDLARLNRWFLAYRPTLAWLNALVSRPPARPLRILDVGCGYGDTLRRIETWARKNKVAVDLIGLDLHPDAIAIAAEATPASSQISWVATDVFAFSPDSPIDLVISSLFAHHLSEPDLIRFLQWMDHRAAIGWFINDLSRAAIPYHLLRIFSKLAGLHPFVQHDGPVSIARAFVRRDWERMCVAAGLDLQDIVIESYKPARLCISRRKT
ncbi:MAG TPA: methyltransferase domain-containing protein [Terracidiphilus sp.]|nr:methyltransferase domain-containing protein [Terracidiphilus sp.]